MLAVPRHDSSLTTITKRQHVLTGNARQTGAINLACLPERYLTASSHPSRNELLPLRMDHISLFVAISELLIETAYSGFLACGIDVFCDHPLKLVLPLLDLFLLKSGLCHE